MTFFSICMTILMAVSQVQQPSVFDMFRQKNIEDCVVVAYEFSTTLSGFKTTGAGCIEIQGNAYHMTADGVEIYCDGTSTWLIDEVAGEVVVESADSKESGLLANPILLLMNLEESGISYNVDGDKIVLYLPDGSKLDIKINSMSETPTKKPEAFRPPTEFPTNWIVTDLR